MIPTRNTSRLFLLCVFELVALFSFSNNITVAQDKELRALDGEWLFVEDQTKGRAVEEQGPPMSVKFALRVEMDAVIYPRSQGEERISLDGSAIEKKNSNGSITRYRGKWKNGILDYSIETIRTSDKKRVLFIRRLFQATEKGLTVRVTINDGTEQVALYRHPDQIALPAPVKATIADLDWPV